MTVDARRFLYVVLCDGPLPYGALLDAAGEFGIHEAELREALDAMCLVHLEKDWAATQVEELVQHAHLEERRRNH